MTDQLDSASVEGTDASQASASESENVSSSGTVTITKEDFDNLKATVKRLEDDNRSNKDKAVKKTNERLEKLEGDVKPLLERAADLIAAGKSPSEAITQINSEQETIEERQVMREFVQAVKDGKLPTANTSGNVQAKGVNMAEVIKEYALDGNDASVISELLSKPYANEAEAKLAAANFKLRRANPTPPDIGASTAIVGSASKSGLTEQEADKKYADLKTLYRDPTINKSKIAQIKKELTDSGYEV
jgi:hypothetical protein